MLAVSLRGSSVRLRWAEDGAILRRATEVARRRATRLQGPGRDRDRLGEILEGIAGLPGRRAPVVQKVPTQAGIRTAIRCTPTTLLVFLASSVLPLAHVYMSPSLRL